jgi:hypothetical protein
MTMQARLVRAMLAALAIAACAGVLAVFIPGSELFARVGATCVVTAVVIGLSLHGVARLDRRNPPRSVLVSLGGIVAAYICAVLGIWVTWLNNGIGWSLVLSAPVFLIFGAMLGAAISLKDRKVSEVASRVSTFMLIASGAAFLVAAWGPAYSSSSFSGTFDIAMHAAGTGWVILLWAIATGCCLLGVGVDRHHWRLIGLACAAAAGILTIATIWNDQPLWPRLAMQCGIIAVLLSHANLMIRCVLPASWKPIIHVAIAATALAACVASYLALTIAYEQVEWGLPGQVLAASVILSGCATLGAVILQRVNSKSSNPVVETPSRFTSIKLECPRCATAQTAPIGSSGCIHCGLLLNIQISTPCCAGCGYVTLDLKSQTCPECGATLNAPGSLLA